MKGQRSGKSMQVCYNICCRERNFSFPLGLIAINKQTLQLGEWNLVLTQNLNTSTYPTRTAIYKSTTLNTKTMKT
jgi:hypothetical protein